MKKIILITDDIHSSMVKSSLKDGIDVKLFIDLEDYYNLSMEKLEEVKNAIRHELINVLTEEIDYIFVFIKKSFTPEKEFADIIMELITDVGFSQEKVLDGYRFYRALYPRERYSYIMENPEITKLDGLVFGISHAESGIRSEYLPGCVKNFSVSSQDIYFNYITAQRLWSDYFEKVTDVKYIVFDMFDYTYFNFESMLTGATINYFGNSGLRCPDEFDRMGNKNVAASSSAINMYLDSKLSQLSEDKVKVFDEVFTDLMQNDDYAYSDHVIENKHLKMEDIEKYQNKPTITSVQANIFEESMDRNVNYFLEFLLFIFRKNPNMKVFLCLLPKYFEVEQFEKANFGQWKNLFEGLIQQIQKKFPNVYYLNYKEDNEVSGNIEYYRDLTHLNHEGAICFTKKLAKDIARYL